MDVWGWVNFLKEIAKTKVFDLTGMNSIEAVKITKAYDVLVFASEEKNFAEAQGLDFDNAK